MHPKVLTLCRDCAERFPRSLDKGSLPHNPFLLFTYVFQSLSPGSGRHRRSGGKDESGKDCPPIIDENLSIEVIRPGKDANGDTSSTGRGSLLKISCSSGYDLNLPKKKVDKYYLDRIIPIQSLF